MKKIFKGLISLGLAGAMTAGILGAAGCKKDNNPGSGNNIQYEDTETRALKLAIGDVEEKFNPMFYTSLNDGIIANMTQVSLITSDSEGKLAFGDDYPTVALDYVETYYDRYNNKLATGDGKTINPANATGDTEGSTTYEFLIKNGMKFSDGEPLTSLDVLFNLYVYLDPLYSGSNTIYSTKIKGLRAYRENKVGLPDDGSGSSVSSTYYVKAANRYSDLEKWADGKTATCNTDDLNTVKKLYKETLTTDWSSIVTGFAKQYEDYYFTEAWQAFLFMKGAVEEQTKPNEYGIPARFKDEHGKYLTELDKDWQTGEISSNGQEFYTMIAEATTEEEINAYIQQYKAEFSVDLTPDIAKLYLQRDTCVDFLYSANTDNAEGIKKILYEGSFTGKVIDAFYQDELTKAASSTTQNVKKIDGITVSHTGDALHNGTFNGKHYDEDHDIVKIEIAGIDPKAKWNFGFTVSPLHYYSGSYGENYKQDALDEYNNRNNPDGTYYDGKATHFGVKYSDVNFINNILADDGKNGVPVGAGPYKCSKQGGGSTSDGKQFYAAQIAYFERNPYFYTMGKNIENAKIKTVTYKVTSDDKLVESLTTGEIDYGEPVAKADNLAATRSLGQKTYQTGGYGYVGINPKSVKDITIRRAIMMAFDTSHLRDYYGNSLVNIIKRPTSNTSWIWDYVDNPSMAATDESCYKRKSTAQEIITYIQENSAWRYSNGTWRNTSTGETGLSFKFTIAGESVDHPAYDMFTYAKRLLEDAGFEIEVGTDIQALSKLVTGDLQVWAAAWSSSIDPDPYQIYSINSQASSTKNWYKDGILNNQDKYATEYEIANLLNEKIMAGRNTLDARERSEIYAKSTGTVEDAAKSGDYSKLSALDLIMALAVEFPTYQRYDLCVYNANILDAKTMHIADASHNMGPISELWKVSYHVRPESAE